MALIRSLYRSRIAPSLVLLDGENEASRSLEPDDCPILRLGVRKLAHRQSLTAISRLRQFWKDHPPAIVQAYFLDASYLAVPVARLMGVRHVLRVRNNLGYWLQRKHRLLNRGIAPLISLSLTNSEAGRQSLIQADRLKPEHVKVLENGVDTERFEYLPLSHPRSGERIRVGCVANLRPVKNIDGFMRSAAQVLATHPQVQFAVAGDGPERPALEELHQQLGLGDRFILHGSVSDIPGFLAKLDVVVLPSHSEGMSNALLEAMAAGRAIIATDVGANRQVLNDTGMLVAPGDDHALVQAIQHLVQEPDRIPELGKATRQHVLQTYSRSAMAERFMDFYESLAGGGKKPASPS